MAVRADCSPQSLEKKRKKEKKKGNDECRFFIHEEVRLNFMDLPECVCVILHFCIYPSILSPYHSFKISIGVVACYSSSFFDFITFHTSFDSDFPKALETFMFVFFTIFLRWDAKKQKG